MEQNTGTIFNLTGEFIEIMDADQIDALADILHLWHIKIADAVADNKEFFQKLVHLHIKGGIKAGDKITVLKSNVLSNIGYLAKMFFGEYQVEEEIVADQQILLTLTKIFPDHTANIKSDFLDSFDALETELEQHNHVLIRTGVPITEEQIMHLLSRDGKEMDYNRYGTSKRNKIKNSKALEVTPWPKEVMISPHNEMSYHTEFPKVAAFISKEPSKYGGETVIYNCAKAYKNLPPAMQKKVMEHNVICRKRYAKNTSDLRFISWQQVIGEGGTIEEAIAHFSAEGFQCSVSHEEKNGETLEVLEIDILRPMVYEYKNETCLHATMIYLTPHWYSQVWPGKKPPLMVTWDTGEPLTYEEFCILDEAILSGRIHYNGWQKHDVLILDNISLSHGRHPYLGERLMGGFFARPSQFIKKNNRWTVEEK